MSWAVWPTEALPPAGNVEESAASKTLAAAFLPAGCTPEAPRPEDGAIAGATEPATETMDDPSPGRSRAPNSLTDAERVDGWILLFSGRSLDGWRGAGRESVPEGHWEVEDGSIHKLTSGAVPTCRPQPYRPDLSADQWQEMLKTEHGGMNEALADLYSVTREERYLALSRRFHHQHVLGPLARQEPDLEGKHANTRFRRSSAWRAGTS